MNLRKLAKIQQENSIKIKQFMPFEYEYNIFYMLCVCVCRHNKWNRNRNKDQNGKFFIKWKRKRENGKPGLFCSNLPTMNGMAWDCREFYAYLNVSSSGIKSKYLNVTYVFFSLFSLPSSDSFLYVWCFWCHQHNHYVNVTLFVH